jgi:AAA+ ATPase superfamily predicted ATPase
MLDWDFYGRQPELDAVHAMLGRERWFFLKLSGRRRIGKTELVRHALARRPDTRVFYLQVPDSEPAGVVDAAQRYLELFEVPGERPRTLPDVAALVGRLMREGWIVALDEFQYFHHPRLQAFSSFLQAEVDALRHARAKMGGLIVLGSVHTEMTALLEDRGAPLFGRVTDTLDLGHLDVASVLAILADHADVTPARLLALWNLFEGIPKFYRDAWERGVLGASRRELVREMFFASSGPLRGEADHWLLQELRGRYDLVLRYVAEHPGCTNADVDAWAKVTDPGSARQVGGYLKVLDERYRLIERLQPVFAPPRARNGRFYLRDNFLRSWMSALRAPVAATHFRPLDDLLDAAERRLNTGEGVALERLVATLYQERSRRRLGDFPVTQEVRGWWDRTGTEVDLVLVDEDARRLRLGTCKRSPDKLVADLGRFDGHVARFLEATPRFRSWTVEKLAVAPVLDTGHRAACVRAGYISEDLVDLTQGLLP